MEETANTMSPRALALCQTARVKRIRERSGMYESRENGEAGRN